MGYKRPAKIYDLRWADEPGLEVAMRAAPVGDLLALMGLAEKADAGDPDAVRTLLSKLAACVVSWNLEDDQGPVPASYDGLAAQDMPFVLKLFAGWVKAMTSVDTPLPDGLPNGRPSAQAPPIPMAPLSSPPTS